MTHGVADRAKPPTPRRRTVLFAPACWAAASLVARPAAGTAARTAAGTAASGATALLIGNSAYRQAPLRRAAGDAQAMAAVLRGMAFDVQLAQDLAWAPMVESMAEWVRRAQDSPLRLFYFAGHGLQAHGRNHLHPVGPAPEHERQLRSRTVDLDEWLERLGRLRQGVSIVFIDACRSEVLARGLRPTRAARTTGLAAAPDPLPRGMVVAFSTGPGSRAVDDGGRGHSPYTRRLIEALQGPPATVEAMLKRVHTAVEQDTAGAQRPWLSTSLVGELCLQPRQAAGAPARPSPGGTDAACARPDDLRARDLDRERAR
ncbi:MAG: caspase family protein [Rubrivivax sp.]|jgi:uncharacterized caspase-like protein